MSNNTEISSKLLRWIVVITAGIIISFHMIYYYTGLGESVINLTFSWGILGIILVNVYLFVSSVFSGFKSASDLGDDETLSKEEKETLFENKLGPILQGEKLEIKNPRLPAFFLSICIGMIAGSILGWLIRRMFE